MELNSNEIQKILPHRYPFLLVDKITDFEPGKWAKGIKCVSVNEMHFCGHFPEMHVMPGVLIIEALAQVGAISILTEEENRGKIAFFGGIKNARFRQQVYPGDIFSWLDSYVKNLDAIKRIAKAFNRKKVEREAHKLIKAIENG